MGQSAPFRVEWDEAGPSLTNLALSLSGSQSQVHLSGETLYYGADAAGDLSVGITAEDSGAGLRDLSFPTLFDGGQVMTFTGQRGPLSRRFTYTISSVQESAVVSLAATDAVGNLTTDPVFTAAKDLTPPTAVITVPQVAPGEFSVVWLGEDETGIAGYDVQYRSVFGETWTPWFSATTDTHAQFTSQTGQAYTFRVRATDNVGNVGEWAESGLTSIKSVTKYYHHGGARVAMRKDGEVYYLHGDHLGSTSLTTDSDGNVVSEARYHPFGSLRWQDGVAVNDFTFTGQRLDGFGLLDYNARYYDSVIGRFISADTVVPNFANPQALNRYAYAVNNPVKFRDPSGHAVECSGGIGGCGWQPANSGVYSTVAAQNAIDTTGEIAKFYAVAALTLVGADFIADGAETVGHIASGNYGSAAISGIATAAPWIPASFVNDIPGVGWLGSKIDEGLGLLGRNGNELELAYAASSSNRLPSPGRRQPGGPSSPSPRVPKTKSNLKPSGPPQLGETPLTPFDPDKIYGYIGERLKDPNVPIYEKVLWVSGIAFDTLVNIVVSGGKTPPHP